MLGTYNASTWGVSVWSSPTAGSSSRRNGISSSLTVASASGPITTTIFGETIASSSITPSMQTGSAIAGSGTGHFTHSGPYTPTASIDNRLSDFITASPDPPY